VRIALGAVFAALLAACGALPERSDPASDAPEGAAAVAGELKPAASYAEALRIWKGADDVNAWIGAKFRYDMARAMLLSETQRRASGRMPILEPRVFFAAPQGVCVDLARFAVETLRAIDPAAKAAYVMIEFDPVQIRGNTLRRHWVVSFERDGKRYVFADSKRPGHIAGPYTSVADFIAAYAEYRGRRIVSFRELESYQRKARTMAVRKLREERAVRPD
jgi:hypothetical protein